MEESGWNGQPLKAFLMDTVLSLQGLVIYTGYGGLSYPLPCL